MKREERFKKKGQSKVDTAREEGSKTDERGRERKSETEKERRVSCRMR